MHRAIVCGVLAISLTAIVTTSAYPAGALSCPALLRDDSIVPRELFWLSSGKPISDAAINLFKRRSTLHLAYIIPPYVYNSGAVIIKIRHLVKESRKTAVSQNPNITLRRDRYRSPCARAKRPDHKEFVGSADVRRYRNYHLYRLPDPYPAEANLNRLHADIGNRPARWFFDSNDRCASTSDWDIRPQFLFEDELADRQPIGLFDYLSGRVQMTYEAQKSSAYAAPAIYTRYRDLAVRVMPYRKTPNAMACISFTTGAIPANAIRTDVMVIDADDARFPRLLSQDPQKTWNFQWE